MYINNYGNVAAPCYIVSKPTYMEESGAKRVELTYANGKCRENSPEGTQTVAVRLLFYENFAIPAMKISPGQMLVILGRERAQETRHWGKDKLERTVIVDWWALREIDPCGMLQELEKRREIAVREKEFKEMFAEFLTEAKPTILKWMTEALMALRKDITAKKDGDNHGENA